MAIADEHFQLKIGIKTVADVPFITVEGECDAFTAPFIHGAMSALIDEGHKKIMVNMESLEFLDVAGFHALDDCCIKMAAAGGIILLVNPIRNVEEIFEVLRTKESCEIAKSLDEALSRLQDLSAG